MDEFYEREIPNLYVIKIGGMFVIKKVLDDPRKDITYNNEVDQTYIVTNNGATKLESRTIWTIDANINNSFIFESIEEAKEFAAKYNYFKFKPEDIKIVQVGVKE